MRADRSLFFFAAAIAAALTIAAARDAHAFCRTTTVPVPPNFEPTGSACFTQGAPLYHPSRCVTYRLVAKESPLVSNAALSDSLGRAFATWTAPNPTCAPGITVLEVAPIDTTTIVAYDMNGPNANVVGFVPGKWPHNSGETLSLTTLTFKADSGEVLDADMEISSEVAWSTGSTVPKDGFDLDSALLHEAGHFLGLAHASDPKAVMFASYEPGSTKRALTDDDAVGVCSIYPSKQIRVTAAGDIASTPCDLSPGGGGSTCGDPKITHGCAATPSLPNGSHGLAWALVLGLAAAASAARRRRSNTK